MKDQNVKPWLSVFCMCVCDKRGLIKMGGALIICDREFTYNK